MNNYKIRLNLDPNFLLSEQSRIFEVFDRLRPVQNRTFWPEMRNKREKEKEKETKNLKKYITLNGLAK